VVSVNHRQIAATRNSGAHVALGERLFFVDADTTVNPQAVASALRYMDKGAAGGGAPAHFDGEAPLYARLLLWLINWLMRLAEISGGAFMFATRDAFHAVGGFDERLFGAEDADMSWALKREGRFVVIWDSVVTSGRRMRGLGGLRMLLALFQMALHPRILRRRASVKKVWYESDRGRNNQSGDSLIVRAINVVMLLLIIALLPVWILVPSSLTPPGSFAGEIRYGAAILGCHISLVLWPCAFFLCRSLIQQRRWIERVKLAALIVLCLWLAWGGTYEVVWFWNGIYGWVVASIFPGTA
jgi:hypothetical protein